MIRCRAIFTGKVQGVGFRYTVNQISAAFSVTGLVRNLSNGSVEVVCEGALSEVDAFMAEINRRLENNIRDCKSSKLASTGQFDSFSIDY